MSKYETCERCKGQRDQFGRCYCPDTSLKAIEAARKVLEGKTNE